MRILAGKQPPVRDEAEFVNRQLRRRRRQYRTVKRHGIGAVAVQRGLAPIAVQQVGPDGKNNVAEHVACQVRVEIIIIDLAILILRVGGTAQIWMQKGTNVVNVRVRDGDESVPRPPERRPRIADGQLILILVELGVSRIEIGIQWRQGRERRALADHRAGRYVANNAQVRVDA